MDWNKRFEVHSHTMYSNLRLLDCINRPKDLINRAIELGLAGIAITDHEAICSHPEINFYQSEIEKEHPDFKIALGNEIYLTDTRDMGQKYYHFILIAKNKEGHRALRELSSRAWMNSYWDRGLERVPTLKSDIEEILKKYPNSLIGTTACLGGELSVNTLTLINAEKTGDKNGAAIAHNNIVDFLLWCKEVFGEDNFYIECAPGTSRDQVLVNKRFPAIAKAFDLKMVIGSDAHYLKKEDRYVHKAYLNSKFGEREVDEFYEFAYLQDNNEIIENLHQSEFNDEFINEMFKNSYGIWERIEKFSLAHNQTIPKVEVYDYPKKDELKGYPILNKMYQSDNKVERYWVNKCVNKLEKLNLKIGAYLSRLEEEADIKYTISEKLGTNMFSYPVTLEHYVNLFWECGSMVGAGRGSSCSGLNHYLLGITQLDPIKWSLPF